MYVVVITAGGQTSRTRTSFPQRVVEGIVANWRNRGFWVEESLPGFDIDYRAYKNGQQIGRITVREETADGRNS